MMTIQLLASLIAVVGLMVTTNSCTPSKRGVQVGSQPVVAKIRMIGVDPRFAADANVIFELSTCMSPTNGTKLPDSMVSFSGLGMKKGAECQVKVKTVVTNPQGITFSTEPNVLYWSRSVILSEDTAGALVGTAALQQTYTVVVPVEPSKIFTISVPVKFPGSVAPAAPITASIDCAPVLPNPGRFIAKAGVEGSFDFVAEFTADTSYKCTNLWVSAAGEGRKYSGRFLPAAATAEIIAGAKVTLPELELSLTPNPTLPDTKDVVVSTTAGACEAGKVFNSTTRVCE